MDIPVKTRQMIADEFGMNYKMFMRRLKLLMIVLPQRVLLLPPEQKLIYDAIYYPKGVNKALYANY
jgi:hypothetical protein